jgi:hypothetical protein
MSTTTICWTRRARKRLLLVIPLDSFDGWGTYVHEEDGVQVRALRGLASVLSSKLATIGRQTAGEPEP